MKKLVKVLALVFAILLSFEATSSQVEAKGDIYFSGKYKNGKYVISLSMATDKDTYKKGEYCGTMTMTDNGGAVAAGKDRVDIAYENSLMKKIGKNKYYVWGAEKGVSYNAYGYSCIIKVKKSLL